MTTLGSRALVLVLGLFFGLLLGEAILRLVFKDHFAVPSHRDWLFRKNWDERFEDLNSEGFRDSEFAPNDEREVYRILALGDSLGYGVGVQDKNDLYTAVLESRLNRIEARRRIEVLNVSKKGWNVSDYYAALQEFAPRYEPDLILLGFFLNDIEGSKEDRPQPVRLLPERLHQMLSRVSYLYFLLHLRIDALVNGDEYLAYKLRFSSLDSADWESFQSRWRRLISSARQQSHGVVVLIFPVLTMLDPEHPFREAYGRVESLSLEEGARVLNLFPTVQGYSAQELWVGFADAHPNEEAHGIFGEAIHTFLTTEALIENTAGQGP